MKPKKRGIDVSEIAGETAVIVFSDDDANDDAILYFTDSDRAIVDSLPENSLRSSMFWL